MSVERNVGHPGIVARREDRLRQLAARLEAEAGIRVGVLAADLADSAQINRVAVRIGGEPRLAVVVNNAGFGGYMPFLELPPDTVIYPGHADPTSVGREWESNAFIRVWRGLDGEGSEPCVALGAPATLVLLGEDYDGGTKAWVRWEDGSDDIVPGSRVERPR